jgi:glutathione-independent formaldehyde dehydrogenase
MVRGRTTAPAGMVLGHEITGEVIEKGRDVEYLEIGDLVSVPFNVACGRCRTCREGDTGVCLNANHGRAGGGYGYVDMGGWIGGQAATTKVDVAARIKVARLMISPMSDLTGSAMRRPSAF